jgi:NAD(P)-dependent dehydrogenase (short-subunit alcohol dehydrogenase family)
MNARAAKPAGQAVAVVTGAGRGFGREIARRLAGRGYAVLCTDIDGSSAERTAQEIGGGAWSMAHDVRDPELHRAAAAAAVTRGPLEVWVNNAGVLRTQKAWEHPDEEVRLQVEANLLGVMWGSRAAVEEMRSLNGSSGHVINMASLSALTPVPGLAVYGATKHGVLGFSESLQGDLDDAGIPVRVHAVCPDSASTDMVRERAADAEAAIIWSAPRMLTPQEVADKVVGLLDSRKLVLVIPRRRGVLARTFALFPNTGLKLAAPMKKRGERKRGRG